MADFQFLQNPLTHRWIILAPRRAKKPENTDPKGNVCPFCSGREKEDGELYRIPSPHDPTQWSVRVTTNKYPFAPIHELFIHSPDHTKSFGEFDLAQTARVFEAYKERYNTHKEKGHVYIFHNRGKAAGESQEHSHAQLTVIPFEVDMELPRLDPHASEDSGPKPTTTIDVEKPNTKTDAFTLDEETIKGVKEEENPAVETTHFYLFCPKTSQWPDEVWITPKKRGRYFGDTSSDELSDLAYCLQRVIHILTERHEGVLPFNFYIYPGKDWYLRLLPRAKSLGGFEIGTGMYVNTQDPEETILFLKEHFDTEKDQATKDRHIAEYHRWV